MKKSANSTRRGARSQPVTLRLVSNVVSLAERRKPKVEQDIIDTLEFLLRNAYRGRLSGLLYACDSGDPNAEPTIGVAGAYRRDHLLGLGAASRLTHGLNQFVDGDE
jgi:hypothetical protein